MMQQDSNEPAVRAAAGQTLMDILEGRPKLVSKKQLIVPILSALAGIIASAEAGAGQLFAFGGRLDFEGDGAPDDGDDDDDSDYDEEEGDINQLAQCCLNSMAMHLPSKYFVEPALQLCDQVRFTVTINITLFFCALCYLLIRWMTNHHLGTSIQYSIFIVFVLPCRRCDPAIPKRVKQVVQF